MSLNWKKDSWRTYPSQQMPDYENKSLLVEVEEKLKHYPPLVFAEEIRTLSRSLEQACDGRAFILQGGDCAETFDEFNAKHIKNTFKTIMQMAVVLTYKNKMPVVKIARMAGQYAKPRSSEYEHVNGVKLPSYKGDIINGFNPDPVSRAPDPERMKSAYFHAAATQNLLRAFSSGGLADLHQVHSWNRSFLNDNNLIEKYNVISKSITDSLAFIESIGLTTANSPNLTETSLFTSHEGLLLNYEEALTRTDSLTGLEYCCSAHMLWIGERTRALDKAHVEFFRGINNPIGIKIGPTVSSDDVIALCRTLNPENIKGRICLISRMGANITETLPKVISAIQERKLNVVWICDPMHGNTVTTSTGIKTRHFEDIFKEIESFFKVHKACGTFPGGIHLEMTGDKVTECIGGTNGVEEINLTSQYKSFCDPRLNGNQVLELSFKIAEMLENII